MWLMSTIKKGLVAPHDPVLNQIAPAVPQEQIASSDTKLEIESILEIAYGFRKDRQKPTVVGLAAPQIGISKRIIAVDIGADGKGQLSDLRIYINPEITWRSKEENEWYEGCWSTDRVCGIVSRPTTVKVKAFTPDSKEIEEEFSGYVARIFQHEIDHLNGQEFITHITNDANLHWVEENEFPAYRNEEAWRNWPHKCPRKKWDKIKSFSI